MIRNQAGQVVTAKLLNRSDGTDIDSGTVTVKVLGDGGTKAVGLGSVQNEGDGTWSYFPTQAETNYSAVTFCFTHALAIGVDVQVLTSYAGSGSSGGSPIDQINAAMEAATAAQEAGDYATALTKVESAWMRICTLPDSEFDNEKLQWSRDGIERLMLWLQRRANSVAAAAAGRGSIIRPAEIRYLRG